MKAFFCIALLFPVMAWAGGGGTAEEARAMLDRAAAHYQTAGRDAALRDFADRNGPWVDRDMYLICFSRNHIMTFHALMPAMVGGSEGDMPDADGQPLNLGLAERLGPGEIGTLKFRWLNPQTKRIGVKVLLVRRFSDEESCGVGYYENTSTADAKRP